MDNLLERNELVDRLMAGNFSAEQANQLLDDSARMGGNTRDRVNFQSHFLREDGDVDVAKVEAFCAMHNALLTVDSYEPVLDERAYNTDKEQKLADLETAITLLNDAGYSAEEIAVIFNTLIRISESSTPHPTESLSLNGTRLGRSLVHAAESEPVARMTQLKSAAIAILQSDDFAGTKKATILEEMDYSSECARVHNAGVNLLDREIEDIIERVTGQRVEINTHTAQCSWAYDADGKNNAEGIAMMMQVATTTMDAFHDLNSKLEETKNHPKTSDPLKKTIEELQGNILSIVTRLQPVYDRARQITQDLANVAPEKREALYRKYYDDEFEPLFKQLSKIYEGVGNKRGLQFFQATVVQLDELRKDLAKKNPEGALLVDEAYRNVRRYGFALEKGQTRHNDLVYMKMVGALMASDAFWSLGILDKTDRDIIDREGSFSGIPHSLQNDYFRNALKFAAANGNRADLLRVLADTNPLSFKPLADGGNGYPEQERAYIDRFRLRALFPYKFEEGIISDAQVIAAQRQKFLADLYGIPHMKHMPLNEDPKNLARQDKLVAIFHKEGGFENRQTRESKVPSILYLPHEDIQVMRPASDAERNGGCFTRLQAMDQYRKMTRMAYDNQACIEIMLGGGQSLNRFGGDVGIVRRIVAQEILQIREEKRRSGKPFDAYDEHALSMAMRMLYTEQGRTRRYASATPNQKRDDFAAKMTQMIQDYLELKGHVPKGTFIDPKPILSEAMDVLQRSTAEEGIAQFFSFSNVVKNDEAGKPTKELLLDHVANASCCPTLLPYQNYGARPAGKAAGSRLSALRAIGKDQGLYTMQAFSTGFYSSGWFMQRMHERMVKGDISAQDISDLHNHADWKEGIFSRNLIDAGRFNASYLFESVSGGKADGWTFDRAIQVGKSVRLSKIEGQDKWKMHYDSQDGAVSQEQAYLCKIYYDRAVFLGMTEAALKPKNHPTGLQASLEDIVKSQRPSDNSLDFGLGKLTQKKYPLVVRDLQTHGKNYPMYAVYTLLQDSINKKVKAGMAEKDVVAAMGGERFMRVVSSAMRAGTLPHKSKWTGEDSYGLDCRRKQDMSLIVAHLQANNQVDVGSTPALG